jgi:hypothetical protein
VGLPTEIIWDGCVDVCGDAHNLWLHMNIDGQSINMFPGDRCPVGGYQVWLQAAWGYDCSDVVTSGYSTEVLVLNTIFTPP